MPTLKLDIEYDFDFEVIGLVSSLAPYQLIWNLNKSLGIDLVKKEDIILEFTSKDVVITNYLFEEEYSYLRVFKNKSAEETVVENPTSLFDVAQTEYFLPELKKYDFIIQLEGAVNNHYSDAIIEKVHQLKNVQLVTPIDLDDIKDKDNLIFE